MLEVLKEKGKKKKKKKKKEKKKEEDWYLYAQIVLYMFSILMEDDEGIFNVLLHP
jgi:hypothetical protein